MAAINAGAEDTYGTRRNDEIYGDNRGNAVSGEAGNDWIQGNRGDDWLWGGSGNDTILGGSGNDFIVGGAGHDILTGHGGRDAFAFTQRPSSSSVDTITDFNVRADSIVLVTTVFRGCGVAKHDMKASAFWTGTAAHDANDRIIYDKEAGALYYDPDGTGSRAAIKFAELDKNLRMTYKDFYMMAP